LRPHSGYRYRSGTSLAYTSKTETATRIRGRTATRSGRTETVRSGSGGAGTKYAYRNDRGRARPVHKVKVRTTPHNGRRIVSPGTRQVTKVRSGLTRPSKRTRGNAYTGRRVTGDRNNRGVRTIKGSPTTRRSITPQQRSVRRTGASSTRGVRKSSGRATTRVKSSSPTMRRGGSSRSAVRSRGSSGRSSVSRSATRGSSRGAARGSGDRRK
jgi:hypothetical protein